VKSSHEQIFPYYPKVHPMHMINLLSGSILRQTARIVLADAS